MKSLPIQYYTRVQGQWSWTLNVQIKSWRALCRRPLSAMQIIFVLVWQKVAGNLHFWTEVGQVSSSCVSHKTIISKWRLKLFESVENIEFNQNLVLVSGQQASWPLRFWTRQLGPFQGEITSTCTAVYHFAMLGYPCKCRSNLVPEHGYIAFEGDALVGKIQLLPQYIERLPHVP